MAHLFQRVAQSRDTQAFAELFENFAPTIKAYMIRQGAGPATAQELAQETLLMVWRKARSNDIVARIMQPLTGF